ncbi:isochorismatase family protein Amidases nicotinamidase -like protein [Thermoplasmatales archaeon BRNA1]|nr:isochorismatase family protein Amidases nicotinamidase -like protein [Thermoplasmatales archaeon BRNA1]
MIMEEIWGKKPAFVVIDAQRKFFLDRPDWKERCAAAVKDVNEFSAMFRKAGNPVIFVKFKGPTCRPYEGEDGDEFFEGIETREGDIYVEKENMNSFLDTNLEEVIKSNGCDIAVMAGTVAQYCVISTYFAAFDHKITSYLAQGTFLGTTPETEAAVDCICKVLTKERTQKFLDTGE